MKKQPKLYSVTTGLVDKKAGDTPNWRALTVVAADASQAIERITLAKKEYVESVKMLHVIDVLEGK